VSFDGIVMRAVVDELQKLVGSRISKIHQPHSTDIVLHVRAQGENTKLLISANPTYPRLHLTTEELVNPQEAPMFCMLLRKHCEGAVIESIRQVEMERIMHMDVRSRDELGDTSRKRLIVEIMGRHSNIILQDPETGMILDSIQHVSVAVSQYRQVLPGRAYVNPPAQNKRNPLAVTQQDFIHAFDWNSGKWDKQIVDAFSGVSPLVAKEIVHRAGLATRDQLWSIFSSMMKDIREHHYLPNIVENKEKTVFSVVELTQFTDAAAKQYAGVSECLQAYYAVKSMRDVVKQKVHDLIRIVTTERNKNEKKIDKLLQTLEDAKEAERYRLFGELITANMHTIKRGDKELVTVNWYDEAAPMITIPLDPLKTPSENLQAYYKRYNKAKSSIQIVTEQIEQAKEEIVYLDGLLVQLDHASLQEAEEIREEMVEQGYVRNRAKRTSKKKKEQRIDLDLYYSSEGIPLLVGKNNKQNDYLTNKLALANETWLHTKDIPGSHVVIRSREFNEGTLLEAAALAAFFSKAKNGSQVPVDYTLVKHVKKPSGAKPGFVTYDQQRTLYITPNKELVEQLKRNRPSGEEKNA